MGNASKAALNDVTRPRSSKGAKIAHLNMVSLRKNKLELDVLVNDHKFDVLELSELRLAENVQDRELRINGYEIYRNDRDTSGGGVAMYVNSTLSHHRREDITDPKLEILWIEVTPKHAKAFVILCWYRPPTSDIDNCSFEALARIIRKIDAESIEIILIGDTNCDLKSPKDGNSRKLKLIYSEFQFEQKITGYTRAKITKSLIDHYSTNRSNHISDCGKDRGAIQKVDGLGCDR